MTDAATKTAEERARLGCVYCEGEPEPGRIEMGPCDQYRYVYRASLSAAPKPLVGLYVVSEDGTARRVEINDETVERVGKPIAYALCKAFGIDPEAPAQPHGEWPNWLEAMGNGGAEAARAALHALTGEER